jgi:hypothetical protein
MLAWIPFEIQTKALLPGEACGSLSIRNQSNCCLEKQTGMYLFSLYSYLSYFHFISSALFQLYIFVLVCLEKFPFAHFINSALMEQIEL